MNKHCCGFGCDWQLVVASATAIRLGAAVTVNQQSGSLGIIQQEAKANAVVYIIRDPLFGRRCGRPSRARLRHPDRSSTAGMNKKVMAGLLARG